MTSVNVPRILSDDVGNFTNHEIPFCAIKIC